MEKELQKLKNSFALIKISAFCEKYGLQYDYLRKVLKGEFKLSENKFLEYEKALDLYEKDFHKIRNNKE